MYLVTVDYLLTLFNFLIYKCLWHCQYNSIVMRKISIFIVTLFLATIHLMHAQVCSPCQPLGYEMVENGQFEDSTIGFSSDFSFDCNCSNGSICITNTASNMNCSTSTLPPTTALNNSNFMIVRGTTSNNLVWQNESPIPVLAGEEYLFTFLVYPNLNNDTNSPFFNIQINGQVVQSVSPTLNEWSEICIPWTSNSHQNVNIGIIQTGQNTTPAIYGIDDISFQRVLQEAIPCQLIVQFDENISPIEKDSLDSINKCNGF